MLTRKHFKAAAEKNKEVIETSPLLRLLLSLKVTARF